jgi:rubrerythrin
MLDQAREDSTADGDYVDFCVTGARASGEYHCADCGYGVTVQATLPLCPMCGGTSWESHAWSPPFGRMPRVR